MLRMLKESNNRRFDSYNVRNSVLIISHITFRDCRVHIFSDHFSRNSFLQKQLFTSVSVASGIFTSLLRGLAKYPPPIAASTSVNNCYIYCISIYTHSDLGDSSNLIGSLWENSSGESVTYERLRATFVRYL